MAPARGICHLTRLMAFIARSLRVGQPRWSRTALASLMLLGMAGLPTARAADSDVANLEREVAALKDVVLRLQARVDRLEGHPPTAEQSASGMPRSAPPASSEVISPAVSLAAPKVSLPATPIAALQPGAEPLAASPQAQLRATWSKIEPGIDADEVSRLLGSPTRKLRLDGRNAWYYSYPTLGNGSVFFTDAGRVSSHQSPFGW